jgi:hypothetical protein
MLVAGIIQGILKSSDLKCVVTSRKLETEKEDKHTVEYLVELEMDENAKWEKILQ